MSATAITSPDLTPPVGPFSQAIKVDGFIYFSGRVGQDVPARTAIAVAALPLGACIEIDLVARAWATHGG